MQNKNSNANADGAIVREYMQPHAVASATNTRHGIYVDISIPWSIPSLSFFSEIRSWFAMSPDLNALATRERMPNEICAARNFCGDIAAADAQICITNETVCVYLVRIVITWSAPSDGAKTSKQMRCKIQIQTENDLVAFTLPRLTFYVRLISAKLWEQFCVFKTWDASYFHLLRFTPRLLGIVEISFDYVSLFQVLFHLRVSTLFASGFYQ